MVSEKMKELEAAKAKLAALEKSFAAELKLELSSLPAKYGFESVRAFVAALKMDETNVLKHRRDGRGERLVAVADDEHEVRLEPLEL